MRRAVVLFALTVAVKHVHAQQGTDPYTRNYDEWVAKGEAAYDTRVINGKRTSVADHPWQVALIDLRITAAPFFQAYCGGVWIGEQWVLTAAHCIRGRTSAQVAVFRGSDDLLDATKGSRHPIASIAVHNKFNTNTYDYDIALLKLASSLGQGPALELAASSDEPFANGTKVNVSGWGYTQEYGARSRHLMLVQLPLQTHADCKQPDSHGSRITDRMLCAGPPLGGAGACNGDSGGPATAEISGRRVLVGLVSARGAKCTLPKKYGVYTRISQFGPWIAANKVP